MSEREKELYKEAISETLEILESQVKLQRTGSWVEPEVAGFFVFSHIRMLSYFRLDKG